MRTSQRLGKYRKSLIALGLTVAVVSALVLVPAVLKKHDAGKAGVPRSSTTARSPTTERARVPPGLDWRAVQRENRNAPNCEWSVEACIVVQGTGKTVALIGDSHARTLIPPMTEIARAEKWTLAVLVTAGCPWQDGLWRFTFVNRRRCLARKDLLQKRVIPKLNPDIVVLVNAPLDRGGVKDLEGRKGLGGPTGLLVIGSPAADRAIEAATDKTVARFRADGRDVVLIEPIPQTPHGFDPLTCLSRARFLDQCRFVDDAKPSATELRYRALARSSDHVSDLDLDRLVCPSLPICDPVIDGTIVWYDGSHLAIGYTRTLATPIRALLTADGVASG